MSINPLENSLASILHKYIDAGFAVLPIWGVRNGHCACPLGANCDRSPGKHPNHKLVPHGVKNASRDKATVSAWARAFPNGHWALRAGEPLAGGGFSLVVDVDPRNGGDSSLEQIEEHNGSLPPTLTVATGGGGNHFIYRTKEQCSSRAPAPGVELIAAGKYFVVSPSKHVSGKQYTWTTDFDPDLIADAPSWACEAASDSSRPEREDGESARNTVLGEAFALAGMLGAPMVDGSYAVVCPWANEHSDARGRGEDSSTVILPPAGGSRFGGFSCKHSHCSQRTWADVVRKLPAEAVEAGRVKYPLKAVTAADIVPPPTATPAPDGDDEYERKMAACKIKLDCKLTKGGWVIKNDVINLITILTYDPRWENVLKYDHFAQNIRFTREIEWHKDDMPTEHFSVWTENALNCLDTWLRREWGISLTDKQIMQAVCIVANRDGFNPLRNYLARLEWDGVSRVNTWLTRYLGVKENDYSRSVGRKWLISAVARAYKPGCKADHVLILEGPQGRGKSTALRSLCGDDWFTDTPIDIGSKDAYLSLRGKWIVELAELSSLSKADIDRAKAFFSSPVDTYRPPYGRIPADFPRQNVFAGTVNLDEYFQDDSGNRRFWPVMCGVIDQEGLAADRDQIWAETVKLFEAGEQWWPTYEERELFESEQEQRVVGEPWVDPIARWLTRSEAKQILQTEESIGATTILECALNIPPQEQDRNKVARLTRAMRALRWVKLRPRVNDGHRKTGYRPSNFATAR